MKNQNQLALYAFLFNTVYNMWNDDSTDTFTKKLGRAALNSVPISLAIDTQEIVECVAKKINVNNIKQPMTSFHSIKNVLDGSRKTVEEYVKEKNMAAYYSIPEDAYKNFQ